MFTDIVCYTALTQSDETQALEVLERHNKLLRPFFAKHHGREVKTIGDSFLVEFDSALDATQCAIEIQEFLHDYNVFVNDSWKIKLRIGIHLGDVVHKDHDIFGDAVNIASRIQSLADPEGVCISEQVFDQIHNKLKYPLERLNVTNLKNVSFATAAYAIIMQWKEHGLDLPEVSQGNESERLRVAILPFTNMSPDPNDEFFADGITEEIISATSKIRDLRVISRTSIMQYKGRSRPIQEISRELRAPTIVEGSVRKAGNKIRVTVQVIDAANDQHLWAESYNRDLNDVFEIQAEIAERVAEELRVKLQPEIRSRLEKKRTKDPEAYTLYLKGRHYWNERNEEGLRRAREHF